MFIDQRHRSPSSSEPAPVVVLSLIRQHDDTAPGPRLTKTNDTAGIASAASAGSTHEEPALLDTPPHPITLQEHLGLPLVIVPLLARLGALALQLGAETWWEPSGVGVPVEYVGGAGREDEEGRIGGGVERGDLGVLRLVVRQPQLACGRAGLASRCR